MPTTVESTHGRDVECFNRDNENGDKGPTEVESSSERSVGSNQGQNFEYNIQIYKRLLRSRVR